MLLSLYIFNIFAKNRFFVKTAISSSLQHVLSIMYFIYKCVANFYVLWCTSMFPRRNYVCDIIIHDRYLCIVYSIGGVMASVLASGVVDRGFERRACQTKDCKIGICCFSAKHAALMRKSKDWLARNQDNVSKWCVVLVI